MSNTSQPNDLSKVLSDLDHRADRILVSLCVIWDLDNRYPLTEKDLGKQDYIDVIRSHTEKMEADLEVVGRKAAAMNDDEVFDWINDGMDDREKVKRQAMVVRLVAKMEDLQKQMEEAKKGYLTS